MPLGGKLPYPGIYPDPLDIEDVQNMASGFAGRSVGVAPSERTEPPKPDIVASETEFVEPAEYSDVPDDPGFYGNSLEGGAATEDASDIIWGREGGPGGQPAVVQPKQLDYDKAGGREPVQEQQRQSGIMADSMERQGQDAELANERLSNIYGNESKRQTQAAADWRKRQIEDQNFYAQRAAQIDQLGDAIARKKIDEGRWIRNPGNFLAAIGAALVVSGGR